MLKYFTYLPSPIGIIRIEGDEENIQSVSFTDEQQIQDGNSSPAIENCKTQLKEYFEGKRKQFDIKLMREGTAFQVQVWEKLCHIPYGRTASYMDIAKAIQNEKSVRAVGAANGQNPIAIIVPCHRVIGHSGKLTGYAGGLWRKQWLLEHEAKFEFGVVGLF
jgi:methylated-DNA-[protein]-cysteine S-methyltransferase